MSKDETQKLDDKDMGKVVGGGVSQSETIFYKNYRNWTTTNNLEEPEGNPRKSTNVIG